MTFAKLPLGIDGALTSMALVRKGIFAAMGGGHGVVDVTGTDLKVSASTPNGQSLVIAAGSAAVPNGYETNPDEVYVVSNPGLHTVTSGDMPGSSGSTTYWLVCIVVGDPAYDDSSHPFMPSVFDTGSADTFQYVRPVVLPCTSSTTTFEQLGLAYPGLALARLAIPPSTTTITSGMITDVRANLSDAKTRRWDGSSSANTTLTNAQAATDLPGLSVTVNVSSPNDVFDVDFNGDVYITGAVANFIDLLVDGAGQGFSVVLQQGAHNAAHGMWTVTGLTPGNHTFKMSGSNYAGSVGTALIATASSKIRVRLVN